MNPRAHEHWSVPWHALQRRLAEGAIGESAAAAAMRAGVVKTLRAVPGRTWITRLPTNLCEPGTRIS